jgi:putative transcriptional regulator
MNRKTRTSRILEETHETALGLHSAGVISKRRMHEYDALRGLQVPSMGARRIRSIRKHANMSQAVFAAELNTSVSTVQKWEIGEKAPSGPSLKLLHVIERKGLEAIL